MDSNNTQLHSPLGDLTFLGPTEDSGAVEEPAPAPSSQGLTMSLPSTPRGSQSSMSPSTLDADGDAKRTSLRKWRRRQVETTGTH
jgi:hypothetical protein